MKKILISLIVSLVLVGNANAAMSDFYSRDWWVQQSGIQDGTINDIMMQYLGILGYRGSLNDMLHDWLAHETNLPTTTALNALLIEYFVVEVGQSFNRITELQDKRITEETDRRRIQ